jgi:acyl transferase domain-containing protein
VDDQQQLAGGLPVQFGVFLDAVEQFDAAAFGVSAPEASLLDPQQRLLLLASTEVLLTAGLQSSSKAGVFIGISSMDYNKVSLKYSGSVTPYTSTGASLSVAAGRLSYTFNLRGPAVSVDTACSSSLVAAHAAVNALTLGQAGAALTGGVNLTLSPDTPAAFQKAGMLAPDGRCKTLDAAADGYVRAEAAGVLRVAPLSTSESVLALVVGAAVNQDGRSSALTAPNGPSQQEVVNAALSAAGLAATQVGTQTTV